MSRSTKDLSHGIRPLEYFSYEKWKRQNDPVYRVASAFRLGAAYLHEVHSPEYLAAMLELVCKDLGRQAADLYKVQLLLDNRKEFTGCKN